MGVLLREGQALEGRRRPFLGVGGMQAGQAFSLSSR